MNSPRSSISIESPDPVTNLDLICQDVLFLDVFSSTFSSSQHTSLSPKSCKSKNIHRYHWKKQSLFACSVTRPLCQHVDNRCSDRCCVWLIMKKLTDVLVRVMNSPFNLHLLTFTSLSRVNAVEVCTLCCL